MLLCVGSFRLWRTSERLRAPGTPGISLGRASTAKMRRLAKSSRLNGATCGRKTPVTTSVPQYRVADGDGEQAVGGVLPTGRDGNAAGDSDNANDDEASSDDAFSHRTEDSCAETARSSTIEASVLLVCGAVLLDLAREALCQSMQLAGTVRLVAAVADALDGGLAGNAVLLAGADATTAAPSASAAFVALHAAYARAVRAGHVPAMSAVRRIAASLLALVRVALLQHHRFLDPAQAHSHELTTNYPSNDCPHMADSGAAGVRGHRKEYRDGSSMTAVLRDAAIIGELFTGRPLCRSGVELSEFDKDDVCCAKQFASSKAHFHGLIIVVCVCRRPKVIGILVMPEADSVSMIASVLLKRLAILPDVFFYDAGCLLSNSLSLRFPSILSRTSFVLDSFQEEGHMCGPTYSARLGRQADGLCSSNTESLNAAFADSRDSIQYLGKHHFMPFLCAVHVYQHKGDVPRVYRQVKHGRRPPLYHILPAAQMPLQLMRWRCDGDD
jgi:hypothetical protein